MRLVGLTDRIMIHIQSGIFSRVQSIVHILLRDTRIRSGLLWNALATITGRLAGLIISIILSRTLGKESFGEFSIVQSTILAFGVFAGFGAGLTATKHIAETFRTDPERAGRILALTILLTCAFGGLMTTALLLGSPLIASRILSSQHLSTYLQVASLGLLASALSGAQGGVLVGFEAFQRLSKINLYSGIISIVVVTIGLAMNGLTGALWGYNISAVTACFLGARAIRLTTREKGVVPDYGHCMHEWPVVWGYSLPTMLSNTLVTPAAWACNAMLVNQRNGFSEMAVYNVATQWRQLLIFLPGIAAQVFLPILSSQNERDRSISLKTQHLKINVIITAPFLIGSLILSPAIMLLYGKNYLSGWTVFAVVQLATFAQVLQTPAVTAWAAEGRMWTNFFANVLWGFALITVSWLLIKLGALGLAVALLISFLLYFVVILYANRSRIA